jgi:hypothetical protein
VDAWKDGCYQTFIYIPMINFNLITRHSKIIIITNHKIEQLWYSITKLPESLFLHFSASIKQDKVYLNCDTMTIYLLTEMAGKGLMGG